MLIKVRRMHYGTHMHPNSLPKPKNIIQGLLVNGSIGKAGGFYKPRDAVAMGAQIALPELAQGPQNSPVAEPMGTQEREQQKEQRDQKLKRLLAVNTVWPAVQFANGPLMLCVPLSFEGINADGNIEAIREQVRAYPIHISMLGVWLSESVRYH